MKFIECKYDGFCREIDQCILRVLLARGDPEFIWDLNGSAFIRLLNSLD